MFQPDNQSSISIVTRSPQLQADAVQVIVTVPTFRRPAQILETLASLQRQQTARRFAVILIENEADKREGAAAAAPLFESGAIEGMVIIAHERGNCCAYNAGFETALANFPNFSWLAIIDDDELADPLWLEKLCETGENFGADLVGGQCAERFDARVRPRPLVSQHRHHGNRHSCGQRQRERRYGDEYGVHNYLNLNSTATSTSTSTGVPKRFAGANRHCRTASTAR